MLGDDREPRLADDAQEILRAKHAAHAVGDAGEVQRRGVQAVSRRVVALPIAQQLHHVQRALGSHRVGRELQNPNGLVFREAIEELAHPDRVGPRR